jgi:hypothetical protein
MTRIVVDAALRNKLLAAGEVAEFRDEAGELIGRFVAANGDWPPTEVDDVSDGELDRREREEPRFTTEQVLDRLRRLRK